MNPPTPHQVAVEFGKRVREEAARDSGDKWTAARKIAETTFPKLSPDQLTFLTWALVRAVDIAFQVDRPVMEERRPSIAPPSTGAPQHGPVESHTAGTDGRQGSREVPSKPAPFVPATDDGRHVTRDAHNNLAPVVPTVPRVPVRSFFRSHPGSYMVRIGNTGVTKAARDLTRADLTTIYRYFGRSEETYRDKREGWQRIAEAVPEDAKLGDVLESLASRDRAFLNAELGIRAEVA